MKKIITSLFLAFAVNASVFALDNIVVDDFETGAISFTEKANLLGGIINQVVTNPSKTAANNSEYAWQFTRVDNETANWSGMWASLTTEIPKGYHKVEVKYYRTNATSQLRINLEGGAGKKEFLPIAGATKTNEWETLTFDLVAAGVTNVKVLGLQPDFVDPVTPDAVVYVDDIKFIYDGSIIIVKPDTEILFGDSGDNTFFDQSWVNVTAPSVFEQVEGHLEKVPVATDVKKIGENALKLTWTSATDGDWKSLVASIGWKSFDLTEMEDIRMCVYSPVALAKANLPKIYLEASTGGTTGKLPLGNYLTTDLAASTWTEVIVSLADMKAADADFAKWDGIKGLFFGQNLADNVSHILYVDEITFNKNGGSSINNNTLDSKLNVAYNNGVLTFNQLVQGVQVYDLSGRAIVKSITESDSFVLNLTKGVYVIKTNLGVSKVLVK